MTEQPETPSQTDPADSGNGSDGSGLPAAPAAPDPDDRIPRPAIYVVLAGVFLSLAIYGLSFVPGTGSVAIKWDSIEAIEAPPSQPVGNGTFGVSRTTLSALAPNEEDLLIYRVAGVVRIDSGGRAPTSVRCDIFSRVEGPTRIARSRRLRAAWPKPSDRLQAQAVPETSYVRFDTGSARKLDLPIRDVARRYTDSEVPTEVEWEGYIEDDQNWIWQMREGTGVGAATLPWVVIFESETRPRGTIECVARVGANEAEVRIPFRQEEWPIEDDQPNAPSDAETGDVPDVE